MRPAEGAIDGGPFRHATRAKRRAARTAESTQGPRGANAPTGARRASRALSHRRTTPGRLNRA
ncbi:hypothetical protein BTH_II1718 [Burkholderia thailandensis E264]|uniref:Uncharacterized protein n=1 Tax=Burkholderia thailandensis (strain ATCC 700388 / DSM 13276 / CCUG 48851 / CIP 106301 / E264) TaxID=271848 RepID=Q2T4I6_BURTA|nr:hypothetical protein BTH_II1718 [Burkholderia thailandensis E264]